MATSLDNTRRKTLTSFWGNYAPGSINEFALDGLFYAIRWTLAPLGANVICHFQIFCTARGGVDGRPLPGDIPDYSYDINEFNSITGIDLDALGGRPAELTNGWIVLSSVPDSYAPLNPATDVGVGTLIYSTTAETAP